MNRQDWEFVGIRLLGVYFVIIGIGMLPHILESGASAPWSFLVAPVVYILAGLLFALRTNRVCSWLGDVGTSR